MRSSLRKTVLVVGAMAVVFFGFTLSLSAETNAAAPQGTIMQHGTQADQDHAATCGCPTCVDMNGSMMLTGKIASVEGDGTLTVQVKPADSAPAATGTAIKELKAGDSIALMVTPDKAKPEKDSQPVTPKSKKHDFEVEDLMFIF
jgi:hypothetical protein